MDALQTQSPSVPQNMDTADENGNGIDNSESQEIIPWKFVPPDARHELIKRLNPTAPLSGKDWRMLACEMGYTAAQIHFIESEKENNTQALFRHYDVKPEASFNDVYKFLTKMQRQDCIDILHAAWPKIRQAYTQAQSFHRFSTVGIPDPHMTGGQNHQPNHSCPCTHAGHSTPAYGNHARCPCGNGLTICGCVGSSHLHSHSIHHSLLPCSCQPEISQAVCTPVHASPSPTYSVNSSVSKNPQTHLASSGYAHEDGNCASALSFPPGSFHNRQPNVYTSCPGSQTDSLNLNVTGGKTVINRRISRETNRQKASRQHNEDCNVVPNFNRDERFSNNCSTNGFGANHQIGIHAVTDPVGGIIQDSGIPNSAVHLNKHANYMDHLGRPSDGAMKKNKYTAANLEVNFLTDNSDGPTGMTSCDSDMRHSWDRDHLPANFPLMGKTKHDGSTKYSELPVPKKSSSVPADTKPLSLRKVSWNSKVFVTYSYDSELHAKQVWSLCTFLVDNGFPCFVDESEDDNSGSKCSGLLEYCRQRISEVDFVLVCISNKYLDDITADMSDCAPSSRRHQLHTRQIYELLNSKCLYSVNNNTNDIARSPRIVPLLFDKVPLNHIPRCMRSGPTYKWPQQHMDLARLLTKTRREENGV